MRLSNSVHHYKLSNHNYAQQILWHNLSLKPLAIWLYFQVGCWWLRSWNHMVLFCFFHFCISNFSHSTFSKCQLNNCNDLKKPTYYIKCSVVKTQYYGRKTFIFASPSEFFFFFSRLSNFCHFEITACLANNINLGSSSTWLPFLRQFWQMWLSQPSVDELIS